MFMPVLSCFDFCLNSWLCCLCCRCRSQIGMFFLVRRNNPATLLWRGRQRRPLPRSVAPHLVNLPLRAPPSAPNLSLPLRHTAHLRVPGEAATTPSQHGRRQPQLKPLPLQSQLLQDPRIPMCRSSSGELCIVYSWKRWLIYPLLFMPE